MDVLYWLHLLRFFGCNLVVNKTIGSKGITFNIVAYKLQELINVQVCCLGFLEGLSGWFLIERSGREPGSERGEKR